MEIRLHRRAELIPTPREIFGVAVAFTPLVSLHELAMLI